jgi:hypothetical protein
MQLLHMMRRQHLRSSCAERKQQRQQQQESQRTGRLHMQIILLLLPLCWLVMLKAMCHSHL